MESMQVSPKPVRLFYFWAGIVATFAYRVIIVLTDVDPVWVHVAWYIGTIGFIIYFAHRFQVSQKRARLIAEHDLVKKFSEDAPINADDRQIVRYLVTSLESTKEKWNYIFIFVLSGLALVAGVILDVAM